MKIKLKKSLGKIKSQVLYMIVENIIYINLLRDENRREYMEKQIRDNNILFETRRVEAIDGRKMLYNKKYRQYISEEYNIPLEKLDPEYIMSKRNFNTQSRNEEVVYSRLGCLLSHITTIETALSLDMEHVLILEDDVIIKDNIRNKFKCPDDADIVYFGGTFISKKEHKKTQKKIIKIDSDKIQVCGTFGYLIPTREKMLEMTKVMRSFLLDGAGKNKPDNWRSGDIRCIARPVDMFYYNYYQKNGNSYFLNPQRVIHQDGEFGSNCGNSLYNKKNKFTYQEMEIQKNL